MDFDLVLVSPVVGHAVGERVTDPAAKAALLEAAERAVVRVAAEASPDAEPAPSHALISPAAE